MIIKDALNTLKRFFHGEAPDAPPAEARSIIQPSPEEVAVSEAREKLAALQDELAGLSTQADIEQANYDRLHALPFPSADDVAKETASQRHLARLAAQHSKLRANVHEALESLKSAEKELKQAQIRRARAAWDAESKELREVVTSLEAVWRQRFEEHVHKARAHGWSDWVVGTRGDFVEAITSVRALESSDDLNRRYNEAERNRAELHRQAAESNLQPAPRPAIVRWVGKRPQPN